MLRYSIIQYLDWTTTVSVQIHSNFSALISHLTISILKVSLNNTRNQIKQLSC
jgi:hypothetical protein